MERAIETMLAFAGTNIDNFIMLSVLLALASTKTDRRNVCAAQYIALAVLVLISLVGAEIAKIFSAGAVRLLEILPVAIGLHGLFGRKDAEDEPTDVLPALWTQAMLNLSGGMDNISVYVPLFERFGGMDFLMLAVVFAGLMGVWCFLAFRIANLPGIRMRVRRYAAKLVPWVYILLGVYILLR